jgi:colanic acid/amylovoran biosynthesis glycosyltransferase
MIRMVNISAHDSMRFAYLISQYPAVNHTFILREVKRLRSLGFEIETVSISDPDRPLAAMTEQERGESASTFYVKRSGVVSALFQHVLGFGSNPLGYVKGLWFALSLGHGQPGKVMSHLFYFIEAVIVGRWMKQNGMSRLHTHFSSSVALIVHRIFGFQWSMTIHGSGEFEEPTCFNLRKKVEAAALVIAISDFGKSQLMMLTEQECWPKIEVARLGVDSDVFDAQPVRCNPRPFELICIGRLAPAKGQGVLLKAVADLVSKSRDVRLRLVGDGPDRAVLERKVREYGLEEIVVFEGWRNQNEVLDLYRRADCFLLASFAEGVPVVLMEAMAMQVPCIATRITGIPELIRDGVDGLLVTPGNSVQLAEAIEKIMDDPGLRERLARAGRIKVVQEYTLDSNVRRLAEIFWQRFGEQGTADISLAAGAQATKSVREISADI